jgi:predicted site-specific integrase-resolvase
MDGPDREPYVIGYARVSMMNQSPRLQVDALKAHGVPKNRINFDRKSGSGVEREQFKMMLKHAREGDVIFVWKVDRLGRNVRQAHRVSSLNQWVVGGPRDLSGQSGRAEPDPVTLSRRRGGCDSCFV